MATSDIETGCNNIGVLATLREAIGDGEGIPTLSMLGEKGRAVKISGQSGELSTTCRMVNKM